MTRHGRNPRRRTVPARSATVHLPPRFSLWRVHGFTALITLAILVILELWRPCFFLTDDNLDALLPILSEIGRRLGHAESPFVTPYLFNGNYNLLRDLSCLNCWHPINLAASLLANLPSPCKFWIIDASSWAMFLLSATGFAALAHYLRKLYVLPIHDGQIIFLATSYTWSIYALAVSSSWFMYTGSLSSLPWLALGAFQQKVRPGLLITTFAVIHEILAGHPEALITSTLMLTLLILGICISRRSVMPFLAWAGGHFLALIALSPLLAPAIDGYCHTAREAGLAIGDMSSSTTPIGNLLIGYFLGPWAYALGNPATDFSGVPLYLAGLAGCLASWCLLPALIQRARWSVLHLTTAAICVLVAVFIARPLGINHIFIHIPVLKSIKWPFRETLQFVFFIHLFLLLRAQRPTWVRTSVASAGAVAFTLGLCPLWTPPPSFNPLSNDRIIVLRGIGDRYWSQVKPLLDPDAPLVSSMPAANLFTNGSTIPYSLLGAMNYGDLYEVRSFYGYSPTAPADQKPTFPHAVYRTDQTYSIFDIKNTFTPEGVALIKKANPHQKLNIISLQCSSRLVTSITLTRPDGTTVDLTPIFKDACTAISGAE